VRVTFNELAERELNDAAQYYESERAGLGAVFIAEVQRCAEAINAHPDAAPVVRGQVRRRLCHMFPYGLLYSMVGDELRVLAVMHLRRRPGYWAGRR
jgi:plasmid stabilization system protein ParE